MQKTIDLYTHSTYSDSSATPEEIVQEAVDTGLQAMALTDHNTAADLPDFLKASNGNLQGTVNRAVIAAELLKKGYISTKSRYYAPPKRLWPSPRLCWTG